MLQVSWLVAESAKVKPMCSWVRLDSRFDWFESVESTCSKSSLVRIGLFVVVGWSPILDLGLVSIGCRSLVLAPVLIAPLCFQLRSSARSLVIVPSLSLVFWNVVLGVASSDNPQCSPWCQSSWLRVSSLLRAPGYDETEPQCVSSLHYILDFVWGVLCSESCSIWSALDGRVVFSPRSQLIVDAARWLPSLPPMLLCIWALW